MPQDLGVLEVKDDLAGYGLIKPGTLPTGALCTYIKFYSQDNSTTFRTLNETERVKFTTVVSPTDPGGLKAINVTKVV